MATEQELKFENWLKVLGWLYEAQRVFFYIDCGKRKWFIVDFLVDIDGQKLVVFIDGGEHTRSRQKLRDELQEMILEHRYKIPYVRVTNNAIDNDSSGSVIQKIRDVLGNC